MLVVLFSPCVANAATLLAMWLWACSIAFHNFRLAFVFDPLSGTSKLCPSNFQVVSISHRFPLI